MINEIKSDLMECDSPDNIWQNLRALEEEVKGIANAVKSGNIHYKGDPGKLSGTCRDILEGMNYVIDTHTNILDSFYFGILIIDKDYNIKFANKSSLDGLDPDQEKIINKKCYDIFCCNRDICSFESCLKTLENQTINEFDEINKNYLMTKIIPYKDALGNIPGCIEISTDITQLKTKERTAIKQLEFQKNEVLKLVRNLSKLADGILNIEGEVSASDEDTNEVAQVFVILNTSLNETAKFLQTIICEITKILSAIANKNLSVEIESAYSGDFIKLKNAINDIIDYFNIFLKTISTSANQVDIGANQVAVSSRHLLQEALEQAGAIDKVSTAVTDLEKKTKQNAIDANEARNLALDIKTDAKTGNQRMLDMLFAMEQIKESSNSIKKINKLIDDIAFQTNILSINAAIEAARAGTLGKGFAVVADEVRDLAARSSRAAKDTAEIINLSIKKVEEGYKIANDTSQALEKIDIGVTQAAEIIGSIADASAMQSEAIHHIEYGMNQILTATQVNKEMSEESASTSEEMAAQAQTLKMLIKDFRLKKQVSLISNGKAVY